uniref:Abasic site processing protein n=1 Tax=Thermoanaerobaculum aquaticum TaxID=1312852 RepID=A0A7C2NAC2_9BACT
MCGRFVQATPGEVIAEVFGLSEVPELAPRYNVAPTQQAAVVRPEAGGRKLAFCRWGLVPSWAKDPAIGNRLINARAETLREKPSFRRALLTRRCVIPATGFYEWKREAGTKIPYFFRLQSEKPMALAGLWEHWQPPEGPPVESFTIITTEANEFMKAIHDRMPAILPQEALALWLDPAPRDAAALQELLRPAPSGWLEAFPVARKVNNPAYDAPDCIAPVGPVISG